MRKAGRCPLRSAGDARSRLRKAAADGRTDKVALNPTVPGTLSETFIDSVAFMPKEHGASLASNAFPINEQSYIKEQSCHARKESRVIGAIAY
ncbi:hypothetical protein NDU88_010041 [Pleurodeles waltl]|uniref:Uncharacterized protein n=1 Tax=Pleurodeles waltl TaxID=8319 RepID=A0AAV7QTB1_PLEWA|nr:hypothetical protein NDU88_010041 [Pleurodeles waltl]